MTVYCTLLENGWEVIVENVKKAERSFPFAVIALSLALALAAVLSPQTAQASDSLVADQSLTSVSRATVSKAVSTGAGKLYVSANSAYDAWGYQFRVSRNKSFTQGVKSYTTSSTSTVFNGLKAGKKYYVKVRAYGYSSSMKKTWGSWSPVKSATVGIKNGKSKIVGIWKIVKTNKASYNSIIKHNKRVSASAKATFTFKKNGSGVFKDYSGKKYSTLPWVALSKSKGYFNKNSSKGADIVIKKGALYVKFSGINFRCVRI